MRGGVPHLAAPLFAGLLVPTGGLAQAPVRTRDASFALVRYETGLTAGALTLYDAIALTTERSTRSAYGLLSLFGDGRMSTQGGLELSRRSAAIPADARFAPLFTALRGEVLLDGATTIQTGYMPTAQVTGRARIRFERDDQGGYGEVAVARAFDGRLWQTVLIGEGHAYLRRNTTEASLTVTPMQLGLGDLLSDTEAKIEWGDGRALFDASLGFRLGEAQRGNTGWGSFTASWSVWGDLYVTATAGLYPADLIQNLPAGRYLAMAFRMPNGRLPSFRRPPPLRPPPPPPPPELPVTARLALVTGPAFDSTGIREVRVWAPGARVVELMADFVDWLPVPLIRQANGEWRGYYRIPNGLHRVNIRLDGEELDAPVNWPLDQDEFLGPVALVLVR